MAIEIDTATSPAPKKAKVGKAARRQWRSLWRQRASRRQQCWLGVGQGEEGDLGLREGRVEQKKSAIKKEGSTCHMVSHGVSCKKKMNAFLFSLSPKPLCDGLMRG
jgi:hypothetical protein